MFTLGLCLVTAIMCRARQRSRGFAVLPNLGVLQVTRRNGTSMLDDEDEDELVFSRPAVRHVRAEWTQDTFE